jgi:hypothetical protein
MIDGTTALTRIGASSRASALVSPSIAATTLDTTAVPPCGRVDAMPLVSTIEPPGRRCGAPYLAALSAPKYRIPKKRWAVPI